MTIGFDGSRAFPSTLQSRSGQAGRTGTENYSFQLLRALSKIDKDLFHRYIVYNYPCSTLHTTVVQQDVDWPLNFEFKEIKWPRLWTQGGLAVQTFIDNLDVLFVPAHTLPIFRRPGLKTVMTVHDLGVEYLPKMHQLKQEVYLKYITRYQLRSATKLIAVSKATKDDLINRAGIDPKKITVVYEGYDKEKFKSQNLKVKSDILVVNSLKKCELQPGEYFLFVGTVQPRKNLERVILAFYKFSNNYKLAIAGQKGWLSDEIYKLPKKLRIETKVKFLGYVSEKDLLTLYSGAIALLFPSLFEGFGLPILEAQASGCPVITSNLSSMPEVAGDGAILVNPYSVEDIIEGMIKVQSVKCKVQIAKAGFENVKRFSWEKCARETLTVLENL